MSTPLDTSAFDFFDDSCSSRSLNRRLRPAPAPFSVVVVVVELSSSGVAEAGF